jgi:predicted dehydrogenase
MDKKIRIGIIGSVGHPEKFIELIQSYDESEVIVYCVEDDKLSLEIAQRQGLAIEQNFQSMLDNYDLDGVIITTPNARKRDLVIAAAKADVGVFLEKPLATNTEDAIAMQRAVHNSGIKFYMSDPFVRPGILFVKQLINDGVLGQVISCSVRYGNDRAFTTPQPPHIYDKSQSGGGIMADVGGHALHIIHYLFGQPTSLCSSIRGYTKAAVDNDIEENANVIMRYDSGMTVNLEASWISGGGMSNYTVVYGTQAWAEVLDGVGKEGTQTVIFHGKNGVNTVYDSTALPPMPTRHVRYFVEMLLNDLPNDIVGSVEESNCGVSIDHAVDLAKMIEACYKASDDKFVTL